MVIHNGLDQGQVEIFWEHLKQVQQRTQISYADIAREVSHKKLIPLNQAIFDATQAAVTLALVQEGAATEIMAALQAAGGFLRV